MVIRKSKIKRETKETSVSVALNIDGSGKTSIDTGIGFLDHLITSFGKHAMLDLAVKARSKDKIEHHLIEDTAIAVSSIKWCSILSFDLALTARSNIACFPKDVIK